MSTDDNAWWFGPRLSRPPAREEFLHGWALAQEYRFEVHHRVLSSLLDCVFANNDGGKRLAGARRSGGQHVDRTCGRPFHATSAASSLRVVSFNIEHGAAHPQIAEAFVTHEELSQADGGQRYGRRGISSFHRSLSDGGLVVARRGATARHKRGNKQYYDPYWSERSPEVSRVKPPQTSALCANGPHQGSAKRESMTKLESVRLSRKAMRSSRSASESSKTFKSSERHGLLRPSPWFDPASTLRPPSS